MLLLAVGDGASSTATATADARWSTAAVDARSSTVAAATDASSTAAATTDARWSTIAAAARSSTAVAAANSGAASAFPRGTPPPPRRALPHPHLLQGRAPPRLPPTAPPHRIGEQHIVLHVPCSGHLKPKNLFCYHRSICLLPTFYEFALLQVIFCYKFSTVLRVSLEHSQDNFCYVASAA